MSNHMDNNDNAEKWTEPLAVAFMMQCYDLSCKTELYNLKDGKEEGYSFHFIGEVCAELGQYSDLPRYLSIKYASCKTIYNRLKSRLEASCFSDSKKGIIKEASAIMNLKSNYGWTDRIDNTTKGAALNEKPLTADEIKRRNESLENDY